MALAVLVQALETDSPVSVTSYHQGHPHGPPVLLDRSAQARAADGFGKSNFAIDGTALRGSRRSAQHPTRLLRAVRHYDGTTLAQQAVDTKRGETTAFGPLLATMDIEDTVVTFDALHTTAVCSR